MDHKSRAQPASLSLLLLDPTVFLSPVITASALLQEAKASTSSFIRRVWMKLAAMSEFLSATTTANSIHSRRLSRERHVPAKCNVLTYARIVSGRYFVLKFASSESPSFSTCKHYVYLDLYREALPHRLAYLVFPAGANPQEVAPYDL